MNIQELYEKERQDLRYSEEYRNILAAMTSEEIEDCFYTHLEFGTAGIRGKMGAGPNRMNEYVIRKVSYAMAQYLWMQEENPTCAIAYDSRNNSYEYSKIAAATLGAYGVKVYRYNTYSSTPELSFALRHLKATGGVVITASHNPPEYNGYKVYHSSGRQMLEEEAAIVTENYLAVEDVFALKEGNYEELMAQGIIEEIGEEVFKAFDEAVNSFTYNDLSPCGIKVVYSPLHGVGKRAVLKALDHLGAVVFPVEDELEPDGNFPKANTPNPEDPGIFTTALEIGHREKADLLIATDPDVDRVGIMVYEDGQYVPIDGNAMGVLMLDYLCTYKKVEEPQAVTTVVSTLLVDELAKENGVKLHRTLTGFKYIGEMMNQFEKEGKGYLLGFEESYGYLHGDHVRDKDAVSAVHLIVEMAALYAKEGKTLLERLEEIYKTYGYYLEDQIVLSLSGQEGMQKIGQIMDAFRKEEFSQIVGKKRLSRVDYQVDETPLPKSNVLRMTFEDNFWFAARPSGTEPKLKIYLGATGKDPQDVNNNLKDIMLALNEFVGAIC